MTDPTPPSLKQLRIQRTAPGAPRRRRWGLWIGAAVAVLAVGAFVLRPGKTEVQVTSVVTTKDSLPSARATATGGRVFVTGMAPPSVSSRKRSAPPASKTPGSPHAISMPWRTMTNFGAAVNST